MPEFGRDERLSKESECPGATILLVEPNEVIRLGLVAMLRSIRSVTNVVAYDETENPHGALTESRSNILAISSNIGIAEISALEAEAARVGIRTLLILHSLDDPSFVEFSQRFAHGLVLLQDITTERMRSALERLERREEVMLPVRVAGQLLQRPRAVRSDPFWRQNVLTQRELDVLTLLSEGCSNKQIAPRIGISEHGVKRHVANVLAKLNCSNRTQAVSFALQQGMLSEPPPKAAAW